MNEQSNTASNKASNIPTGSLNNTPITIDGEKHQCSYCQKTKNLFHCGSCKTHVCKSCAQILPEDAFFYLDQKTELQNEKIFCSSCFENQISNELNQYDQDVENAKNIDLFFKSQSKETRLIRRTEKPLTVSECEDREETLMRLAFKAAKLNYNTLVDVDLVSEKVRMGSYQTLKWKATGIPVNMNERQVVKDRSIWQNPN